MQVGDTVTLCTAHGKAKKARVIFVAKNPKGKYPLLALQLCTPSQKVLAGFVARQDDAGSFPARWWHE